MKSILKIGFYLALLLSMTGCGVHRQRAGHSVPVPNCVGGYAYVPEGCYSQQVADGIEIRCPNSTTKFGRCKN